MGSMRTLDEVAKDLGLDPSDPALLPYGHDFIKVDTAAAGNGTLDGKLVVVSGVTPTPLGEGKTVTSISLAMGLNRVGQQTCVCLRQPSLGPVFGAKGGGTGGGVANVEPAEKINLGMTGDGHAIGAAHNLISAMLDASLRHGNPLDIDSRFVSWPRCAPVNDGALRKVVTGLGGPLNGVPRESSFEINEASEVMAIVAVARDRADLRKRLGAIILGRNRKFEPITAEHIGAAGAASVLLREVLFPTLVQTSEGTPGLIHTGPFANIAHGNSSILATKWALTRSPWVVTEGGFGSDLGLEKFMHIKARMGSLKPACVVVTCTVRAMKLHAGVIKAQLGKPLDPKAEIENVEAVRKGGANLAHHIRIAKGFGAPVVVALNRFPSDTDAEIAALAEIAKQAGAGLAIHTGFVDGGKGAEELAKAVVAAAKPTNPEYAYPLDAPILDKLEMMATKVYGAEGIEVSPKARQQIKRLESWGFDQVPLCVAKTHLSTTHDPKLGGMPQPFVLPVREVQLRAGAGFVTVLTGDLTTMPALGKKPNAFDMDVDPTTGEIKGVKGV